MSVTTASHEGTPKLRADARRNIELILDAAEASLARDPDASMSDIAAEAGLERVTIYGHFTSRQVLIETVVRRVLAAANAALDELDFSGDAVAALEQLVDATWRLILRSGSLPVAAEKALPAAHLPGKRRLWVRPIGRLVDGRLRRDHPCGCERDGRRTP